VIASRKDASPTKAFVASRHASGARPREVLGSWDSVPDRGSKRRSLETLSIPAPLLHLQIPSVAEPGRGELNDRVDGPRD